MRLQSLVWLLLMLPLASAISPGRAQKAAPTAVGGFDVLNKPTFSGSLGGSGTVRLDGANGLPVRIRSAQIDLSAQVIAVERVKGGITQIRSKTGVKLMLNLTQNAKSEAVRLEAQSDDMVLNAVPKNGRRTLVLSGNVNGFYEIGGARSTLRGNQVTISFGAQPSRDLRAEIEGGKEGVRLEVAGQSFGGEAGQVGNIVLTAQRALIDQTQGQARLIGKARAVSSGGANTFDVAAAEFVAKLGGGAARSLDSLQTVGRAQIKISMPQPRTPAKAAPADGSSSLRPTYIEVAADNATVAGASQTLTLDGNLQGFYRIADASGAASASNTLSGTAPDGDNSKSMAGDYPFSGSRAVIRMVSEKEATAENPAGPNLDISGVSMQLPGLDLGFGDDADDKKKNINGRN